MNQRDAEYAVDRLFCLANDETFPPTYSVFLILTGNLNAQHQNRLNYQQAIMLADALTAWCNYPSEINSLIQKHRQEFLQ